MITRANKELVALCALFSVAGIGILIFMIQLAGVSNVFPSLGFGPPALPAKCSDISVSTLNRIWQNNPLIKRAGTQVLAIDRATDVGSAGVFLRCDVRAIVNTAGMITLRVTSTIVGGNPYIQIEPTFE